MVPCARIDKPLEAVQEIAQSCRYGTDLNGKPRVYVMDEFQSLSRARFAQEAMLDVLEQDDRKAYFFLCSTDPQKILKTIRGRCVRIHLRPIPEDTLAELVTRVAAAEGIKLAKGVADRAAGQAGGSAREALKALERLRGLAGAGQMAELVPPEVEAQAFNLVKVLTPFKGRPSPKAVCKILESLEGHDPEEVRRLVLTCARRQLLRCDHTSARAYLVIQAFRDTLYSGGQADHAVLAAMAWEACHRGGEG
jgi:DNA polymerase III delta prime subunit